MLMSSCPAEDGEEAGTRRGEGHREDCQRRGAQSSLSEPEDRVDCQSQRRQ